MCCTNIKEGQAQRPVTEFPRESLREGEKQGASAASNDAEVGRSP